VVDLAFARLELAISPSADARPPALLVRLANVRRSFFRPTTFFRQSTAWAVYGTPRLRFIEAGSP